MWVTYMQVLLGHPTHLSQNVRDHSTQWLNGLIHQTWTPLFSQPPFEEYTLEVTHLSTFAGRLYADEKPLYEVQQQKIWITYMWATDKYVGH